MYEVQHPPVQMDKNIKRDLNSVIRTVYVTSNCMKLAGVAPHTVRCNINSSNHRIEIALNIFVHLNWRVLRLIRFDVT